MKNRLQALLSVKSIVTIILTIVFAVCVLMGNIPEQFLTVYTVVIAFYFGTQANKNKADEQK